MSKKPSNKQSDSSPAWLKWAVIGGLALIVIAAASMLVMNRQAAPTKALPAEISVDEAYNLYKEGVFLLDVRTQEEWVDYHAPGTTLIPLDELPSRLAEVPTDQTVVVICRSGNRSQQGRDILQKSGYDQVTSMAGGLKTWQAKGYPVISGP
jgi:rhodanese-related sulfurtransferase